MGASRQKLGGLVPGCHGPEPLAAASGHFLPVPRLLAARTMALWDSDLSSYSFTSYLTFFLFFHLVCLQFLTCNFFLFFFNLFSSVEFPDETDAPGDEEKQRRQEDSEACRPGKHAGSKGF